ALAITAPVKMLIATHPNLVGCVRSGGSRWPRESSALPKTDCEAELFARGHASLLLLPLLAQSSMKTLGPIFHFFIRNRLLRPQNICAPIENVDPVSFYDNANRLTSLAMTVGATSGPNVALGYDNADRMTSITRTIGGVGNS